MTDNVLTEERPTTSMWNDDERAETVVKLISLGLLLIVTAVNVAVRHGFTHHAKGDLIVVGAAALWMAPTWVWPRMLDHARIMSVFLVGLLALMTALNVRSPIYGFWSFTGYFWVGMGTEGAFRYVGVLAVAAIAALSQTGGAPKLSAGGIAVFLGAFAINGGASIAISRAWFAGEMQSERRRVMIAKLTAANQQLQDALAENAALQEQLVTQAREAGIAEERQRMAREIHDTLAQGLTGIITQLQAAEQAGDTAVHGRHVRTAIDLARESLSEARRSVNELAPEPLSKARLPEALRAVTGRFNERHGVEASVTTTGEPRPIAPELEVALLRTAQEALANVAKHARASRVGLTLSYMEDQVTLDVRDDGVGFVPGAAAPERRNGNGGFGLAAMRQRLDGVAGILEIESEPDGGTAISASIPLLSGGGQP
jgi:signal transduction histidine kinase